jgi:hypothetical protein
MIESWRLRIIINNLRGLDRHNPGAAFPSGESAKPRGLLYSSSANRFVPAHASRSQPKREALRPGRRKFCVKRGEYPLSKMCS